MGVAVLLAVASGAATALTVDDDGTTDDSETVECPSTTNGTDCQGTTSLAVDADEDATGNETDEANATASANATADAATNGTADASEEAGASASASCDVEANGTPCQASGDADPDPQASEEAAISESGVKAQIGLEVACALEVPDAPCEANRNTTADADVSLADVLPGACFWNLCLF